MRYQGSSTPVVTDPCVVLGRFAGLLADGSALPAALDALVAGLGLRTAVLRSVAGELLAVGGEALHAVPALRSLPPAHPSVELPVSGRAGTQLATLTVKGARPSQLPILRTAAAVVGLALALAPTPSATDLFEAAEADRDELADSLHDGPVQSLVVARYAADAAVRGGDATIARDAVQQALVEVRRTLWSLRPRGSTGLVAALEQLVVQLAEAGAAPLGLLGGTDVTGPHAVLAFRLVQAVTGPSPVRVALRVDGPTVVIDIDGGAPLPSPERWVRRARSLGGDLAASAGRLRLALPATCSSQDPAPSGNDARTSP